MQARKFSGAEFSRLFVANRRTQVLHFEPDAGRLGATHLVPVAGLTDGELPQYGVHRGSQVMAARAQSILKAIRQDTDPNLAPALDMLRIAALSAPRSLHLLDQYLGACGRWKQYHLIEIVFPEVHRVVERAVGEKLLTRREADVVNALFDDRRTAMRRRAERAKERRASKIVTGRQRGR